MRGGNCGSFGRGLREKSDSSPDIARRKGYFFAGPECRDWAAGGAHAAEAGISVYIFGKGHAVGRGPVQRVGRGLDVGREISRRAALDRDDVNVSADGTFVAHQSLDECHVLAAGRDARTGDLRRWLVNLSHLAGLRVDQIEARDPPVR